MLRDNARSICGISAGWSENVLDEDMMKLVKVFMAIRNLETKKVSPMQMKVMGGDHKLWLAMLIDKISK